MPGLGLPAVSSEYALFNLLRRRRSEEVGHWILQSWIHLWCTVVHQSFNQDFNIFWAYHYELCTLYRPLQAMIRNCISDDNPHCISYDNPQFCAPEISYIKDWHYEWDSFVTFPHVIGQKLIRLTKYIFLIFLAWRVFVRTNTKHLEAWEG